ncbi:MAG: hypothetical protein JWQ57_3227 [Mucilaginibacter sp.]|nr:hypothetical protein [Mucilaginibacter sp.]
MSHHMECHLPVRLAVKKFIARQYPVTPFLVSRNNPYGMFLYNSLAKLGAKQQPVPDNLNPSIYNSNIKLLLSEDLWRRKGWYINPAKKLDFNKFVEQQIDQAFYQYMDVSTAILHYRIYNSILAFREYYGFTEDDYSIKTLEKKFERYRNSLTN